MSDGGEDRIVELEARIERLEAEVGRLSVAAIRAPQPASSPPPPPPGQLPVTSPPPPAPVSAPAAPPPEPRTAIDSEVALKWGGVALVVLAVGFAVNTAISRGWIGPELQLAGAVGFSLALVAVGIELRSTRLPWSHALCVGGVAALYTTFASDLFLDQTNVGTAQVLTIVVGLAGLALARFVPSEWVGVVTLLSGFIAWVVIGDAAPPFEVPFGPTLAVLAVAVALSIALSIDRRWFALRLVAHVVGMLSLLALAGGAESGAEQAAAGAVAAVLFLSLFYIPSIGDLQTASQQLEVQLASAAAPWGFAVVALAADVDTDAAAGSIALGAAALTALGATAIRARIKPAHFVSLVLGASVALSIGLGVLLSTEAAFVGIAVQGAGLVVLSRLLGDSIRVLINAGILMLIAAVFALGDGLDAWSDDAAIGADIARLAILAALAVGLHQTRHHPTQRLGAAALLGLLLVWLGSVLVHLPEGQAAVSVSWAVVGMALLVAGAVRKVPDLATAGLAVLALTIGKLLVVDMTEVDTLWRAGLFLAVGLALMRLGFLLPRLTGADSTPAEESA